MTGKKELLADILFNSHLVNLFKRLPMRNKLIVLNYHRIRSNDPEFSTAFDDGVYSVDSDEFARQIKWLKSSTRIMSEKDLLDQNKDGVFIPPKTSAPCVVITFDDGYLDNYTLAYPILKYYEAPAILFVSTQMVHARQIPWWDVIAYLIKQCAQPFIRVDGRQFSMGNQRKETIAFFQSRMKQEKYEHTKYLLSELSEACEVALPAPELQDKELLTWKEIREMAQNHIAIGSHTHTHRVLSTLSPSAQKEEMILSKLIIEENIGQPVLSISYPVGEPHFITAETPVIASISGYSLGFTANTGVNDWTSIQPFGVKRTARLLEKVSTVSLLTVLPGLFSWDSAASAQIKLMESHPTYADAYYRLGVIHLGQGKIEQAISSFQQAVDSNPDYTEARIKLGISQGFAGRYDEAEKNLSVILEKRPSFADIYYYLGIIHASNKQILKAVEDLEKAVKINPAYKDAMLKLGVLYCQQQRYNLALNMLERASRLDPSDQDLLALVEAGRNIIAAHGDESSDLVPLFASYVGNSDQIDELVKGFVTHLSISPNLNDIMAIIEKGAFPRDNLESLLLLFQDYRAIFPEYSDIHYMLGILYKKLDHVQDAERCFTESIRLNPNYVKARLNLFNLLKEQGRFKEALEHGYALERFNLLYPDLYCGLAETFLGLGRYSEAEEFARKAVAISPVYQRVHQVFQKIREHDHKG
jgi:tetratricopeptide (TPR) repeat protein/peptidoglycan/xylan/chitin deacetylase (PgdA/CDA1 family)